MATFTVRKDGSGTHTEIQSAIYDAANGDTIDIGAGTFYENVELYKNVVLVGAGKDVTVIRGKLANDTYNCTWFAGDQVITTASTAGVQRGKNMSGTYLTAGSRVDQVVSETEIRLSQATATTGNYTKVVSAYQTVAFSVAPTSGTFKLRYNGVDTAAINWNDTAATIQTKLRAVAGLSTVLVTGTIASKLLTIAFDGVAAPVTALSVSASALNPSVVVTPTLINGLVSGSSSIILPNTTSVVVGHKVEGTGVNATVTAINTTTKTITLSSPITQSGSNVTLTFRLPRSITVSQVTNPSASSPPASLMLYGSTTGVQVKDLTSVGFDGTVGQEAAALGITAGTAPGHVSTLFDGCRFTADGDSAVICGSNPYLDGTTFQNCIFDGKTFTGSEPADIPSFSTFVAQGVVQSIGASTSVIRFADMRGINVVGRTFTCASAFSGSATISAISGNDVTFNKVASFTVGQTLDCTFTLTAYSIPNCARNLVYIGQNITPNNTKNVVFKDNVINGQTGALITATGSKAMFNTAVTIESVGGLVENNLIDGIFGAGQPNVLASNFALRCRQAGIVVQNNINNVGSTRENSGYLIGTDAGLTVDTNVTVTQGMVRAVQASTGEPVTITVEPYWIKILAKVKASPIFSDQANWKLVGVVYKNTVNALRFTPGMRGTYSKLQSLKTGMASGQNYEFKKVILSDENGNMLVIYRSEATDPSTFDFALK